MGIHITPSKSKWKVRKTGGHRALRVFPTKDDAVAHALTQGQIIYIHDLTGRICNRIARNR